MMYIFTLEFPTPTGKTKIEVETNCTNAIKKSLLYEACAQVIDDFDISNYVQSCVTDTQVNFNISLKRNSSAEVFFKMTTSIIKEVFFK